MSPYVSYDVSRLTLSPFIFPHVLKRLAARFRAGGDDGNRTHDPLLAGQVLSQLSYTPIFQ